MTLYFLNVVANDAEATQKIEYCVIFASLKNETMGKLINRITGSCRFDIKRHSPSIVCFLHKLLRIARKEIPHKIDCCLYFRSKIW